MQCTKHKSIAGDRLDCGARISLDTFVDSCATLCEAAAFTISCQLINDSNDITLAFKSILRVVLYLKYISQLFAGHAVLQLQDLKSNLGLW